MTDRVGSTDLIELLRYFWFERFISPSSVEKEMTPSFLAQSAELSSVEQRRQFECTCWFVAGHSVDDLGCNAGSR